ncbi:hypothetical protein J2W37_002801 [Variovorax paradoxus]|uniref:hypothetical protein n=1 Tax=Variovorax paradoxus TaxID=34073 RepID=UPI00278577F3|nr:hypothetical protein [Variovorax paradoxus]MDP9965081.1 hypothetical protein [Variovorax paradoxus]
MAAHRYWRIRGLEPYAAGALALSELQLFSETTRVDGAAALSSNTAPSSGTLANLKDDNLASETTWTDARSLVLSWDFGAGGDVDVTNILLGSADNSLAFPAVAHLQWSDDGAAWSDRYPSAFIGIRWPGPRAKTGNTTRTVTGTLRFDKSWSDQSMAGETVYSTGGGVVHGIANGYRLQLSTSSVTDVKVRFDAMPSMADVDIAAVVNLLGEPSVVFRTSYWAAANDTYGYVAGVGGGNVYIGKGTNSSTPAYTAIAAVAHGLSGSGDVKLRVTMVGSAYKVFVNDVLRLSGTDTTHAAAGEVGVRVYNGTSYFNQLQVREPEETHPLIVLEPAFARLQGPAAVASLGMTPAYPGASLRAYRQRTRPDYVTGILGQGIGRVRGFTLDYVSPLNKPYPCRVRLMRDVDGLVIRELWSGADGGYDFQYIDELQSYTVVAYYLAHGKRAVITDGLTLANGKVELMP